MIKLISGLIIIVFAFWGCQSEVNSPERFSTEDLELYKFETIESDLFLLERGGMHIKDGDGVFSMGWNEIFRPFDDNSTIKGMAFAVAFGNENTGEEYFHKYGIDMGNVKINYVANEIVMHKMQHDRRGIAYSLFQRPFGASDQLLEFVPNTEYQFNVSGSDQFSPITITLTSPESLIDITSHSHGEEINPNEYLTLTWNGGNAEDKVALRLMPHFRPMHGERDPRGHRGPHPGPRMHDINVIILDSNTGEYTIASETLQNLVAETNAERIVMGVSQFEMGEIEHDGKILNTAMRNGNSVMLNIVQ